MYGLNIDPNNPNGNPHADELSQFNVEMVRYTFHDTSGGDQLDQSMAEFFSRRTREYHEAGIRSLIILTYDTYPGRPAPDAPDPEWDSYIEHFARRAGQIASLLSSWQPAFQVWNEPDHPVHPGYAPTLRPEVFGRVLRRTHNAIKDADPNATVVTAGLVTGNPAWLTQVIESLGGDLPADIVAFHPYGQRPDPDWPHPDWLFGYVGNLLNGYYEAGQRRPVWITEMGVQEEHLGNDRDQVAEFLRRYYRAITTRFSDKVEQLFWFCYSDGMVPTFGLTDQAGNPKPAFHAFRNVAAPPVFGPLEAVAPPPPVAQPEPFSESFTPSTSTFVIPFRQSIALELARLKDLITRLQDQVQQLQKQIAGHPTDDED